MNYRLESPQIVLVALAACAICSLVLLIWGKQLARRGDWLAWIGLTIPFAALATSVVQWTEAGHQTLNWARGWIGPRSEAGAILVGLILDGPGLVFPLLILLAALSLISSRAVIARMRRPECAYAGACVSAAGASFAWLASTPWLTVAGWSIASFGGFLAFGSEGLEDSESNAGTRYARERSWGVILAWIGMCGIAIARGGLEWAGVTGWSRVASSPFALDQVGSILVLAGIFLQLQLFPFLGGAISPSSTGIANRGILSILMPGISAFALLWRVAPFLGEQRLLVPFGIVLLVCGTLNLFSALFQPRWRQEFYPWLGAGFALAGAVLAFGGQAAALSLLVAFFLGASAISISATFMGHAPDEGKDEAAALKGARAWTLFLCFGGIAATTGMLGFASAQGIAQAVGSVWTDPALAAPVVVFFTFFVIVGWSLAWRLQEMKRPVFLAWPTILPPVFLLLTSLAVGWTGTLSGSPLFSGLDQTSPAWIHSLLPAQPMAATAGGFGDNPFAEAALACLLPSLAAILASYFISRRKDPLWAELPKEARTFKAFVVRGYDIDPGASRILAGLQWFGRSARDRVDGRAWTAWAPSAAEAGIRALAKAGVRADERISWAIRRGMRASIEGTGGVIQALQSGNVQWYVMFAIGSSILLLLHFLT